MMLIYRGFQHQHSPSLKENREIKGGTSPLFGDGTIAVPCTTRIIGSGRVEIILSTIRTGDPPVRTLSTPHVSNPIHNCSLFKVAPFREHGMGWGLKVAEDVPKGSLVGEYVGEVSKREMGRARSRAKLKIRLACVGLTCLRHRLTATHTHHFCTVFFSSCSGVCFLPVPFTF